MTHKYCRNYMGSWWCGWVLGHSGQ